MKIRTWMTLLLAVAVGCSETPPADTYANSGDSSVADGGYGTYYGTE